MNMIVSVITGLNNANVSLNTFIRNQNLSDNQKLELAMILGEYLTATETLIKEELAYTSVPGEV